MKPTIRSVETEVLPPEQTAFERDERLIGFIAKLMDTAFVIPGTKIRFGLDPIIGLLPGVGDAADAVISSVLLSRGIRYGVPKIVLIRMALNVAINAAGGSIPVIGDAFSVWFKSNAMNYDLLRRHALGQRRVSAGDWLFVFGLIGVLLLCIALGAALVIFLLAQIAKALG
jgi:hypothetical protein